MLNVHRSQLPAGALWRRPMPVQDGPGLRALPGDRTRRQVQGIDAWNASSRLRQALLSNAGTSPERRLDGARRLDVLRRTHEALVSYTAFELAARPAPMLVWAPTAVIAHHHLWFRDRARTLLTAYGFDVVACTDNGADALGVIIAEQPDLVLVGDRLATMTPAELLSETALFSPLSALVASAPVGTPLLAAVDEGGAEAGEHEDTPTARLFEALCEPLSLQLLLHVLEVGEYDLKAACRQGAGADIAARLGCLVDVGLLVRHRIGRAGEAYRLADAAAVARLLGTVRRLEARRRAPAAPDLHTDERRGIDPSPAGHATPRPALILR